MPYRRRILASSSVLPLLLLVTSPVGATYSIAAVDQATQAVGGAVTSCVGSQGVTIVYGTAPGFGVINAQASVVSTKNRDTGVQLLQMGTAPATIIQQLNASDTGFASRQYGVVDLQGRAAGHTGTACGVYAEDLQGTIGTFTYSIQGNILTSAAVLTQAQTAFRGQGCDLAERLMLALEGGAQNSEGDRRCTELTNPVPANAAMIQVDLPGQTPGSYLRLTNAQNGSVNAVTQLRTQFNTWRQTHPCMQPPDGGTGDAGGKDAGISDVNVDRRDGGDASVDGDASGGTGGTAGAGGTAGTAGTAGAAGSAGTGGSAGSSGAGGAAGTAGSAGTGGAAGTGGSTGGASGTGGAAGKGGAAGTAGSGGSGGIGTGGASGTGGAGTSGGGGAGGASGSTGGSGATGGRGGSGTGGSAGTSGDDGCSCRLGRRDSERSAALMLSGLALFAAGRLRRSKRRK